MTDSPEAEEVPAQQARRRLDWGNVPQWISAVCAIIVALVAIYALFFSATSQMLVAYLHSELASRNSKIAALEAREQQLHLLISRREIELGAIEQRLATALVKEKISTRIAGTMVVTWPLRLVDEFYSQGIRPRKEQLWIAYLNFIRTVIEELPSNEQALGQEVLLKLNEQCSHLSKVVIDVPSIKLAEGDAKQRFDALQKKVSDAQSEIKQCLRNLQI